MAPGLQGVYNTLPLPARGRGLLSGKRDFASLRLRVPK